jgi:hypothetical protein
MKHSLTLSISCFVVTVGLIFMMLSSAACNVQSIGGTVPAATDSAETEPATNLEAEVSDSEPESTSVNTPTSPAAGDPAPPTVEGRTLVDLNLRQGPGTNYLIVTSLPADTEFTGLGRNDDGSWIVIEHESEQVWLSGDAEYVELDAEALADLPEVDVPASTVKAADNPAVQKVLNEVPLIVHHGTHQTCASNGGLNNLFDVANGNLIGPHSGDFVYDGNNVLFEYSNGSLLLIRESPQASFDNGEKYLPFNEAIDLFASGEIVWTGSLGEWPARGVTGCDPQASP